MSRGKRCTEGQIIKVLREIESGASIASVARPHGIAEQTLCRGRGRCAGMAKSELAELKALQEENRRLRAAAASQALGIEACKELQRGKWRAPPHGDEPARSF
jgi:putative transposase